MRIGSEYQAEIPEVQIGRSNHHLHFQSLHDIYNIIRRMYYLAISYEIFSFYMILR